jgi:hypothetical protein
MINRMMLDDDSRIQYDVRETQNLPINSKERSNG